MVINKRKDLLLNTVATHVELFLKELFLRIKENLGKGSEVGFEKLHSVSYFP